MATAGASPIPFVVQQHVEEVAHLRNVRSVLVGAPHVKLLHLHRLDERIAAHLDGVAVAGEYGARLCAEALATPSTGTVFAATVRAIEDKNEPQLNKLFALVGAVPEVLRGMLSAFGWVSAEALQGTVSGLLSSKEALRREVGIAACVMHGVDPGMALARTLDAVEPRLRARALRATGELGQRELLAECLAALPDADTACRFWAAWSAVLLGERGKTIGALEGFVLTPNPFRSRALGLLLKVLDLPRVQQLLKTIAQDPANKRLLIHGAGIAGDGQYLPWLIGHMSDDQHGRLAGASFSMITGLDLAYLDLERKPPEGFEVGPTESPDDEKVDMDPDDSLPWPDATKIQAWWHANQARFQPGTRYFMGAPLSVAHCNQVLREGYQRQRSAAALYLSLLRPGTPLFAWRAPAWRQQRWLIR